MEYMVDLETLGTDSNSVIVTVSILACNLKTSEIYGELELSIDMNDQVQMGALIDPNTVVWWLQQSKESQEELLRNSSVSVYSAVEMIERFIDKHGQGTLWGNGATFDNVILRNLYSRHGQIFPIPFWRDRDVRTIVDLGGIDTRDFKFTGTKHKGLDDCKHQLNYCSYALSKLGK